MDLWGISVTLKTQVQSNILFQSIYFEWQRVGLNNILEIKVQIV